MDGALFLYLYRKCASNRRLNRAVILWGTRLPQGLIVLYVAGLLYFLVNDRGLLIRFSLVPLSTLLFVTLIRNVIDRPRPFERYDIEMKMKHSTGQSFPSRHTASAVVISFAFYWVWPAMGIVCFFISFVIALSRVMAGLHYPGDVLAGAGISIFFGYIGFFVL